MVSLSVTAERLSTRAPPRTPSTSAKLSRPASLSGPRARIYNPISKTAIVRLPLLVTLHGDGRLISRRRSLAALSGARSIAAAHSLLEFVLSADPTISHGCTIAGWGGDAGTEWRNDRDNRDKCTRPHTRGKVTSFVQSALEDIVCSNDHIRSGTFV